MLFAALMSVSAFAVDFTYTYEGQELLYTITSDSTCEIKSDDYYPYQIKGTLVIPTVAKYEGKEYSVTAIGILAFFDCKSLTSVVIPNSVKSIGSLAFSGCGLTSVEIPNSVTTELDGTFSNCYDLKSVKIPNSITELKSTFSYCRSLTSVEIPNSVTNLEMAFRYCDSLTTVKIPNSVTNLSKTFYDCDNLTSVEIPNSVTELDNTFFSCFNLTSVVIPSSVISMDKFSFLGCDNLKEIYYKTTDPIEFNENPFEDEVYSNAVLYIAKGALQKALTTRPWKFFKEIKEIDFAGINDIEADTDGDEIDFSLPVDVYNLKGQTVAKSVDGLPGGVYIVHQGNKTKKIVVK